MADLTVRPMARTEGDLARFKACFDANNSPRTLDHLRWQFFEAPGGDLLVDFAEGSDPETGEDRLAGIYAVFPVPFDTGGQTVPGAQSIDTLTDHRFRGQGVFKRLARSCYGRVEESGRALVYGFPNGSSAHGFFRRLEWTDLDPLHFWLRPLRTGGLLRQTRLGAVGGLVDLPVPIRRHRRRRHALEVADLDRFDSRFDDLWERVRTQVGIAVRRDAAYLNWRLRDKPGFSYAVRIGLLRGQLVGFVAWRETDRRGGLAYVMELLADPEHPWVARVLLSDALRRMRDHGMVAAQAQSVPGSPVHRAYPAEGFLSLPNRWASEVHFGARAFDRRLAPTVDDRRQWHLSYCDSDTL